VRPLKVLIPLIHRHRVQGAGDAPELVTTLGAALEAFIREHEYCGELDADVGDDHVWMTCACGARMSRRLDG
jgi:hypothetical protein